MKADNLYFILLNFLLDIFLLESFTFSLLVVYVNLFRWLQEDTFTAFTLGMIETTEAAIRANGIVARNDDALYGIGSDNFAGRAGS